MSVNELIKTKNYEKVIGKIRRHPITFVPAILLNLLLMVMPAGLYFIFIDNFSQWLAEPAVFTAVILLASFYELFIIIFFYSRFIIFYLDVLIVTNDRMVDIDQTSLFGRTVAEIDLYQIQDATSEVNGFFPTLFNYGNVRVQTAGTLPNLTIINVRDPHTLRQHLLDLAAEDKKFHAGQVNAANDK